ncbi:MAG: hypothetical protein E7596_03250 [Ruminococcaceae bacterium]|nr:hypothetical protein [Oscillospiraceae bacterium]
MKKFLALALAMLLFSSCLCLTSCDGNVVDSINGESPEVAFANALKSLDEIDKYSVVLSQDTSAKILFVPIYSITMDEYYFYSYEGKNEHYGFTEAGKKLKSEDPDIADVVAGFDDDLLYYNGVCYETSGTSRIKYTSETSPYSDSEYEEAVADIIEAGIGDYKCYQDGDLYYFVIENDTKGEITFDDEAVKETFTVYFNEDGLIQKINIEIKYSFMVTTVMEAVYSYGDDAMGVQPPQSPDSYTNYDY